MRTFYAAALVFVVALLIGGAKPAQAAFFSISGIGDQPLPASLNDLIPTPDADFQALVPGGGVIVDPDGGELFWSGGATLSTTAADVAITYNYIGSFAEATNVFSAGGLTFQNSGVGEDGGGDSMPRAPIHAFQALAGPVDFAFSTSLDGGSSVGNIAGNNAVGSGFVNYLMSYLEPAGVDGDWKLTSAPGNAVLILFDDAGKGPDRNDYDDLGVIAIATPLPASLPLFAAALGGLGLMVWRRTTKNENVGRPAE